MRDIIIPIFIHEMTEIGRGISRHDREWMAMHSFIHPFI